MKKSTKRRETHYHTGVFESKKGGSISYRSGWEKSLCEYLDADSSVISYSYESIKIPYTTSVRSRRIRTYIPDFSIEMTNDRHILCEVKPLNRVMQVKNQKKFEAAENWCKENGYEFIIITEFELKQLSHDSVGCNITV